MRTIMCSLILLLFSLELEAQTVVFANSKDHRDVLFAQSVKSCDEFMCRFNGKEFFPGITSKVKDYKQKNFLMLFDSQLATHVKREDFLKSVYEFYDSVRVNHIYLEYESQKWYAEENVSFFYKGKNINLGIVLQPEKNDKNKYGWTIVGVNGLEKLGYRDSSRHLTISPEQHEADFIELESCFKLESNCFSELRNSNLPLDALSYFFALVETKTLVFDKRVNTTFHFFDVPGYVFSLRFHNRNKANNGWLISKFAKIEENNKQSLTNKLLGK